MKNIAVLITTFNRKEVTLRCLGQLTKLTKLIDIYLVDDDSNDGTASAIAAEFNCVTIIQSMGNLYWNRGMHLAWSVAKEKNYSFYLWLNNDVILYDNSIVEIMSCSKLCKDSSIITGIIESHDASQILYGGTDDKKYLLAGNGKMQDVTNMNGNVVLVPASVFDALGNLDPYLHHDLGDVDYGLRARAKGIKVLTTRVSVGSCDRNNTCRVRFWGANIRRRFEKLYSPLGSHPKINFYFRFKHFGLINAMTYWGFIHILNVAPDWLVELIFDDKYIPN